MDYIPISVSEIFQQAWNRSKTSNGFILALVMLVYASIISSLEVLSLPEGYFEAISSGDQRRILMFTQDIDGSLNMVASIVSLIIGISFTNTFLIQARDDKNFAVGQLLVSVGAWFKALIAYVIMAVVSAVGFAFCIIPGIYFMGRLYFAPYVILDKPETSVGEAIRQSWNMTRGHVMDFVFAGLMCIGIYILGFVCCCVGALFAYVIIYFVWAYFYLALKPKEDVIKFDPVTIHDNFTSSSTKPDNVNID